MMTRLTLMKYHAVLAAFILPVALMYMITGALYTWGIKGGYIDEYYDVPLTESIQPELISLSQLAKAELNKQGLSVPTGEPKIKKIGTNFMLDWAGSSKYVTLEPTADPLVAKLTVKHTTWYRTLVQLHKAKGGPVFKVYAVVFSIFMVLLLISGFIMAWQSPKLKRLTVFSSLTGIASFIVLAWLS